MKGFVDDIEELTEENADVRRVLYTAKTMQLVLMALQGDLRGVDSCWRGCGAPALGV